MRNTADVTGGNPIAVWSQSISDVSDINLLVAFYDIHGENREVLFFYFVPDTPRDNVYTTDLKWTTPRGDASLFTLLQESSLVVYLGRSLMHFGTVPSERRKWRAFQT
jgi:hypothetical protein